MKYITTIVVILNYNELQLLQHTIHIYIRLPSVQRKENVKLLIIS